MRSAALILSLIAMVIFSCHCAASNPLKQAKKGAKEVSFVALKNYYVRNNTDCSKPQQLIFESKEKFESYFGPAAIMGGAPTDINWEKQFVIAIVLPETNCPTTVTPMKVKESPGNIIFYYQVNKGHKTSHTQVPFAAVAIQRVTNSPRTVVFFIED